MLQAEKRYKKDVGETGAFLARGNGSGGSESWNNHRIRVAGESDADVMSGASLTPYHCQYWANALVLRGAPGSIESITRSIASARVDLNTHQVDASLFALRSPLSKGAVLADEVGLGKTIEPGLIVRQFWAERRRRILCILPAGLREQWHREMLEKFFIESVILETKNFNRLIREGGANPLGMNVGNAEVRQLAERAIALANCLVCVGCGEVPRRETGSYWECRCRKLRLYPLANLD